jgi:hypothetical protein
MDEPPELQHNRHWRMAVLALRVGYLGLAVAIGGLIALAFGSTSWVLASGVIIWLATVPVTLTGFLRARHELPEPRPRLWSMRLMLVHDSIHTPPSAQRSQTAPPSASSHRGRAP